MKTITINERTFELFNAKGTQKTIELLERSEKSASKGLLDFYEKPSTTKFNIYYDWCKWFNNVGAIEWGVESANCNQFTMTGLIRINGTYYFLYITKLHNRAYELQNILVP